MKRGLLSILISLVCSVAFSQLPWETAFFDDFNRANGDLGSDYTPQVMNGTVQIEDNMVLVDPVDMSIMYWMVDYNEPIANKNIKLSIDFKATEGSSDSESKFAIMAKGGQNLSDFSYAAGVDIITDSISISMWDMQGTQIQLESGTFEMVGDSLYHLEFIIMDGELEFTVTELFSGDEATITYSDTDPLTGFRASINGFQDNDELMYFDNYQIDTLEDDFSVKEITTHPFNAAIFPNPVRDILNIALKSETNNEYAVQVIAMDGRLVQETSFTSQASNHFQIPVNHLSAGVHSIRIISENFQKVIPFVKN